MNRSDRCFKPAVLTRLCEVKVSTFEMTEKEKEEILSREMKAIKKNQMEILEFKSIIIETKNSLEGLNSKFQWLDGRIIKLEDRLFNTV